jgi:pimeloyl-ACP methyl ester carboxylesterase
LGHPDKPEPAVFSEVARFTGVCAYDRPGTPVDDKPSRSDPAPQPTTAADGVAALHALLSAAGEAGPYVLVEHSYGGLIVRLYAHAYPREVSGLALVDALSKGLRASETPDEWAIQRRLIAHDDAQSLTFCTQPLKGSMRTVVSTRFARLLRSGRSRWWCCPLTGRGVSRFG